MPLPIELPDKFDLIADEKSAIQLTRPIKAKEERSGGVSDAMTAFGQKRSFAALQSYLAGAVAGAAGRGEL